MNKKYQSKALTQRCNQVSMSSIENTIESNQIYDQLSRTERMPKWNASKIINHEKSLN